MGLGETISRATCTLFGHLWRGRCHCARCFKSRDCDWEGLGGTDKNHCQKCRRCGGFNLHAWNRLPLEPNRSPCLEYSLRCSRCALRSDNLKHQFSEWVESGLQPNGTLQSGSLRTRHCERCHCKETQVYYPDSICGGTGVCQACKGSCCDAYGTSCNSCCGTGDCFCDHGGYWHAQSNSA
jgi:hypothetical protein